MLIYHLTPAVKSTVQCQFKMSGYKTAKKKYDSHDIKSALELGRVS